MAANQKKATTVRTTKNTEKQPAKQNTAKKTSTKRKTQAQGKKDRSAKQKYSDGLMLVCVTALMIFITCCNIGLCGTVGKGIRSVFFGLFGMVQYILPFAIIFGAFIMVAEQYSSYILRKITLSCVMALLLCALCHMIVHIDWGFDRLIDSFVYSKEHKTAGGILGAFITSVFYPFLDKSGTYLLIILSMGILFLFIGGDSLFHLLKSAMLYFKVDEEEMIARENYRARREEHLRVKQEMRKTARKQYYEEAAKKEDDALSKLLQKRMERSQQAVQSETMFVPEAFDKMDKKHVKGAKKEKKVLSDEGFIRGDLVKEDNDKTVEKDNTAHVSDTSKEKDNSVKENTKVHITPKGELKITGIVEESYEEGEMAAASMEDVTLYPHKEVAFAISDIGKQTLSDAGFTWKDNAEQTGETEVVSTTAHFVDAEDLEIPEQPAKMQVQAEQQEVAAGQEKVSHRRTKETARETALETEKTAKEIAASTEKADNSHYQKPLLELLQKGSKSNGSSKAELQATAKKLEDTLNSFGVHVTVTNVSCGPAVTRYEMLPEQGTRVSKITGLADDIKLNLAVADIRIEAPIPGKAAIGIEIPNKTSSMVAFRDLLEESDFMEQSSDLSFAVGKDIGGNVVISDIAKMPHVLIAGATGSGKSVCINTLIMSLLYKTHPDDVKLIMIDPKVVELSVYNGIPHLLIPVVTDPKKASGALNWAVAEMDARYKKFAKYSVRGLEGYNQKVEAMNAKGENPDGELEKMPKIVIIVDELADLMMVAHGEVEDAIVRLSQLARAAGIHLVIATQRPSVDVITGLIKANVPSRIAFAVSSGVDSRTILDMNGAEKLLGKGDMLFAPSGYPKPVRVQGAFISDREVGHVVEFLKAQDLKVQYNDNITKEIVCGAQSVRDANKGQERDEYFVDAARCIIEKEKASIGMLQRIYKIGFNRAARIMDQLCEAGVVGPEEGTKPRQVIMSKEEFENLLEQGL